MLNQFQLQLMKTSPKAETAESREQEKKGPCSD